jgi:hypothetical protein
MKLVLLSLLAAHVPGRDDPDVQISNRKDDEQPPISIRPSETEVARLSSRVLGVEAHNERPVEEDLLTFPELDSMPLAVLVEISLIPVEVVALLEKLKDGHVSSI